MPGLEPLPRLVVVVDEFATLAAELPDFLKSLVGIAQRGRSLGVHMVLATQRPAGVVTEDIRANTSCRIALRVTDRHDSNDVIDATDAARIPRRCPGRALARFGPGELVAFQSALATGTTSPSVAGPRVAQVGEWSSSAGGSSLAREVQAALGGASPCPADGPGMGWLSSGRHSAPGGASPGPADDGSDYNLDPMLRGARERSERLESEAEADSDLDRVVRAVREAHRRQGGRRPRSPWPTPLPDRVSQEDLSSLASQGEASRGMRTVDRVSQEDLSSLASQGEASRGMRTVDRVSQEDLHCPAEGGEPVGGVAARRRRAALGQAASVERGEPVAWLVDDPARQRQFAAGWRLGDGHLVVMGGPASGSSTTLAASVLGLCRTRTADDLHVYAIDLDAGLLSALDGLPHTGAVVAPTDADRRARVLRFLDGEVAARRGGAGSRADIVLIVDDLAGLARAHDPVRDAEPHERFARIWSDGPAVGVRAAVSIARAADLPPDLAAAAGVVLIHATSDASDGARFGLRASTAGLVPGRAVRADDGREVQIGLPGGGDLAAAVAAAAAGCAPPVAGPVPVGSLPASVGARRLPVGARAGERCVELRFAMSDLTLEPMGLTLHDGEHALVLGPPRTGRTGALAAIALAALSAGVEVAVVADGPSELSARLGVGEVSADALTADGTPEQGARRLLLIDDAERADDPRGVLARIAASSRSRSRCHLIAATSADRMRSSYGHWLSEMRSCRTGVLFRPGPLDGDLLAAALPARVSLPPLPGRGLIVADGTAAAAQVALAGPAA